VKQTLWKNAPYKYEIWGRKDSKFEELVDQQLSVLTEPMTVTPLSSLCEGQRQVVDVAGVVRRVSDIATVRNSTMRELEIADDSGVACLLTLWGSWSAKEFSRGDIVAVRKASVSTFKGLSLSTSSLSSVTVVSDDDGDATLAYLNEVDVDSLPLLGHEKRRKTEKLLEISKSGGARVTIRKIFIDRKMTFTSKKTGDTEAVLKMAVEDDSGRRVVSGSWCFLFVVVVVFILFLFLFLFLFSDCSV